MNYETLSRDLKADKLHGLYLLYGNEGYLIKYFTAEIMKRLIEPSWQGVSFVRFEGRQNPLRVYDECMAYPMAGPCRMVVLDRCGLLSPGVGAGARKGAGVNQNTAPNQGPSPYTGGAPRPRTSRDTGNISYLDVINDLQQYTCLVIIEEAVDKRLALYNKIKEKGFIAEITQRSPGQLEHWARALVGRENKTFTQNAVRRLIENSDGSMTHLKNEIDKLLAYTADRDGITADDVSKICAISLKTKIYDLVNFIGEGGRQNASMALDTLYAQKEPVSRIMSALANHFTLLRQLKELSNKGAKLHEATKLTSLHPYRAEKLWKQCGKFSQALLGSVVRMCYNFDKAVKNGKTDDKTALETLIASIFQMI